MGKSGGISCSFCGRPKSEVNILIARRYRSYL
ncbi:MAG: hypothetical protein IPM74_19285 [Crocinitomicaceae bacterium]|nr:hypothetical protein [Crocinitomicaceae bacterium]